MQEVHENALGTVLASFRKPAAQQQSCHRLVLSLATLPAILNCAACR